MAKSTSVNFSPEAELIKLYQNYISVLQHQSVQLTGSIETFLNNVRREAEEFDRQKEILDLNGLDEKLKKV